MNMQDEKCPKDNAPDYHRARYDRGEMMPPALRAKFWDGSWWDERLDDKGWLLLGVAPYPRTRWQWFKHHILHGLLMDYPFWSVLKYAITKSGMATYEDDRETN
jgi:hypothetical protein